MKIIVGLGNPGDRYEQTKHNAGFMLLDYIVEKKGLTWEQNKKFNCFVAKGIDSFFIKPLSFMNNSGRSVQAVLSYYKLLPKKLGLIKEKNSDLSDKLIVAHDDLDINLGKYKTSVNSRSAGHNGVQSIINHLKTKNFTRIRIGIKNEEKKQIPVIKQVLMRFDKEEEKDIKEVIKNIEKEITL